MYDINCTITTSGLIINNGFTFATLFIAIILGGLVGGLIYYIDKIKFKCTKKDTRGSYYYEDCKLNKNSCLKLASMNMIIGVGGAFTFVALYSWVNDFSIKQMPSFYHLMFFAFSASVVSGFAAKTLLPKITNGIEQKLNEQFKKTSELEDEMTDVEKTIEYRGNIQTAQWALNDKSLPSDATRAVTALSVNLKRQPEDRKSAILLSRVYDETSLKNLEKAIENLQSFITIKGSNHDLDYADVLYNLSCYLVQKIQESGDSDGLIIKEVMDNLEISFTIKPENKNDAMADVDFESIKEEVKFKKLVGN